MSLKQFVFSDKDKQAFENDGYLILENFLNLEECDNLRSEIFKIIDEMNPEEHNAVFSTGDHEQMKTHYMLQTSNKIGFFWEALARDENGKLLVPKYQAFNKIGHALHSLSEPFKEVTFDEKIKEILRKLGYIKPVVPQSMYIFKSPGIGGEVNRHIDATFLYSDPLKLMGFWIALEDATLENGCLRFVPGSHKTTDVSARMIRNPEPEKFDSQPLVFKGSIEFCPFSDYEPKPVKKGSLVLIDGQIQHYSKKNTSDKSRNIYTFHVTESHKSVWSEGNWLQPPEAFPAVYDDSPTDNK